MTKFLFSFIATIIILFARSTFVFAWCGDCSGDCCACPGQAQCLDGYSSCEEACGGGAGRGVPVDTGPSVEEIRQQKEQAEQKDLNEAAQDADDKGTQAYERGDWSLAVKYYKEALGYSPDDPDILSNLNHAQQKINLAAARATEAARQLQSISQIAEQHSSESSKTVSQLGFDTSLKDAGPLTGPTVIVPPNSDKDPVVPNTKRTPAITALEDKRTISRDRLKKLDETLKTLDPNKDAVQTVKLKEEVEIFKKEIHYLNFSIGEILDKPKQDSPDKK